MAREAARVAQRCETARDEGFLDLSSCDLTSFPDGAFVLMRGGTTILTADLSGNFLKTLPSKFAGKLGDLTQIRLNKNELETLPNSFGTLPCLKLLDLSDNKLTSVPEAVYSLSALETLIIKNNSLFDINIERLKEMKALKVLEVDGNSLTEETLVEIQTVLTAS